MSLLRGESSGVSRGCELVVKARARGNMRLTGRALRKRCSAICGVRSSFVSHQYAALTVCEGEGKKRM